MTPPRSLWLLLFILAACAASACATGRPLEPDAPRRDASAGDAASLPDAPSDDAFLAPGTDASIDAALEPPDAFTPAVDTGTPAPSAWACGEARFRDALCDCGCGAPDPACEGLGPHAIGMGPGIDACRVCGVSAATCTVVGAPRAGTYRGAVTNNGFRWCIDRPYEPATHAWCTGHLGYQLGGTFVIRLDAARNMTGSAELYGFPVEICRATVSPSGRADFAFCSGGTPGVPGFGWFTADGFVGEIWEGGERYKNGYLHASRSACGVLASGERLTPGQTLSSCGGTGSFAHQGDGNVVAYRGTTPTWNSGTSGRATTQLVMQTDGNLVLYGPGDIAVWSSVTAGNPGASLFIADDGIAEIRASSGARLWP